jgi:chromosome segregation ATPase
MPMSQPEQERRIIQNTNDILSIYDMLSGIDATLGRHSVQLANIETRLSAHDERFDAVDERFDAVDQRFDAVDQRFDAVDQRFDAVDQRFDSLDAALAEVLRRLPG